MLRDLHTSLTQPRGWGRNHAHFVVNHGSGEYVRDRHIHTNSIESVWALLKSPINCIYHWVSPKHLSRYVDEMSWRYNRWEMAEGDRANALISGSAGRLTYKALIA
jgi:hypothetical protein